MNPTVKFRLQRPNFVLDLEFKCFFDEDSIKWIYFIDFKQHNPFLSAFEGEYSNRLVKIGNLKFILDQSIMPEVEYIDAGGVCVYYLTQYGVRIKEIDRKRNDQPLIIEILNNSSYFICFPCYSCFRSKM